MARICDRCERGSNRANSRSHSNVATKRQQFANLQDRKIGGVRMRLCTRCLKTMARTLREKVAAKSAVQVVPASKKKAKVAAAKAKVAAK